MEDSHTAVFPGRYESLAEISEFAGRAAEASGLNEDAVFQVQLAVDEACSNIIKHAYGGEGQGQIECTCRAEPRELTMILRDRGRPFDLDSVPDPDIHAGLEERQTGGLGVYLIRKLMDEVHLECTETGNVLTLVKRQS